MLFFSPWELGRGEGAERREGGVGFAKFPLASPPSLQHSIPRLLPRSGFPTCLLPHCVFVVARGRGGGRWGGSTRLPLFSTHSQGWAVSFWKLAAELGECFLSLPHVSYPKVKHNKSPLCWGWHHSLLRNQGEGERVDGKCGSQTDFMKTSRLPE